MEPNGSLTDSRLKKCQEFAVAKHDGLCLATAYVNNHTKMLWQCKFGHQWEAHWNSIKDSNTWCPTCANNLKLDIKELQHYAITKGGILISTEYKNNRIIIKWPVTPESIPPVPGSRNSMTK